MHKTDGRVMFLDDNDTEGRTEFFDTMYKMSVGIGKLNYIYICVCVSKAG